MRKKKLTAKECNVLESASRLFSLKGNHRNEMVIENILDKACRR